MAKLFVNKTVEIDAPPSRVWEVLTRRIYTDLWALEFSSGGPQSYIESDWKLGSPVLWTGDDSKVIVEGTVTAMEPNTLLRFTVSDTRSEEKAPAGKEDGITFKIAETNGKTLLQVLQGDFSVMPKGDKYYRLSAAAWDRVLPIIKRLAERKTAFVGEVQP